jgi:hypothetical protein
LLCSPEVESEPADFIDENEDLSTIPEAKVYEPEAPRVFAKKDRKGPVRIMAPLLDRNDDSDEESEKRKPFVPMTGCL